MTLDECRIFTRALLGVKATTTGDYADDKIDVIIKEAHKEVWSELAVTMPERLSEILLHTYPANSESSLPPITASQPATLKYLLVETTPAAGAPSPSNLPSRMEWYDYHDRYENDGASMRSTGTRISARGEYLVITPIPQNDIYLVLTRIRVVYPIATPSQNIFNGALEPFHSLVAYRAARMMSASNRASDRGIAERESNAWDLAIRNNTLNGQTEWRMRYYERTD